MAPTGTWSEACSKQRYGTRADAERVAAHQRLETGTKLRVYQCEDCGGWHLTKQQPWRIPAVD